jgi:ABC-type Mn2+/Zn2+ transport system permease subunit
MKEFLEMMQLPFMQRALVVGILISICCALLGVNLVLKHYAMIGDGLSHVGFGALALGMALGVAPLIVSIPLVILAAVFLLHISDDSKIESDSAIAILATSALAIGAIIISLTTGYNIDIYNYMFGSILALTNSDLWISLAVAVVVIVLFLLFYHQLFSITFDETFARATGAKAKLYKLLLAILTAIIIVVGMRMMGALLISSLIIFPALTSMRVCKKYKTVIICSVICSLACFLLGFISSSIFAIPTGASIVVFDLIFFLVFALIAKISSRHKE